MNRRAIGRRTVQEDEDGREIFQGKDLPLIRFFFQTSFRFCELRCPPSEFLWRILEVAGGEAQVQIYCDSISEPSKPLSFHESSFYFLLAETREDGVVVGASFGMGEHGKAEESPYESQSEPESESQSNPDFEKLYRLSQSYKLNESENGKTLTVTSPYPEPRILVIKDKSLVFSIYSATCKIERNTKVATDWDSAREKWRTEDQLVEAFQTLVDSGVVGATIGCTDHFYPTEKERTAGLLNDAVCRVRAEMGVYEEGQGHIYSPGIMNSGLSGLVTGNIPLAQAILAFPRHEADLKKFLINDLKCRYWLPTETVQNRAKELAVTRYLIQNVLVPESEESLTKLLELEFPLPLDSDVPAHAKLASLYTVKPTKVIKISTVPDQSHFHPHTEPPRRILCLDGGGIRSLASIHILQEMCMKTEGYDPPRSNTRINLIKQYFDILAGTGSGGICVLAFGLGYPFFAVLKLWFQLRREILYAQEPQKGKKLEEILQAFFGTSSKMQDIRHVRVLVGAVYGEPEDSKLKWKWFTNFQEDTKEELVWKVARRIIAAPGIFKPMEESEEEEEGGGVVKYRDGSLLANNPTLRVLKLLQENGDLERSSAAVVSVGTGFLSRMNKLKRIRQLKLKQM